MTSTNEEKWRAWIRKNVRLANPLLWVAERSLACAPRPLRYHPTFGGRVPLIVPEAAPVLREWLEGVKNQGIGTIVALATPGEIRRYASAVAPEKDLLSLYQSFGFMIHHHPVEDPAHAPGSARAASSSRWSPSSWSFLRSMRNAMARCSFSAAAAWTEPPRLPLSWPASPLGSARIVRLAPCFPGAPPFPIVRG